jgi:hypothetical protein
LVTAVVTVLGAVTFFGPGLLLAAVLFFAAAAGFLAAAVLDFDVAFGFEPVAAVARLRVVDVAMALSSCAIPGFWPVPGLDLAQN